jgi:hypothetical protein
MLLSHGILPLSLQAYFRLGYRFYRAATYYEFGRDAYEAIVICSFMILMCNFLGTELHSKFQEKTRQRLVIPLCCIRVNPSNWVCLFLTELMYSISWKQSNGLSDSGVN